MIKGKPKKERKDVIVQAPEDVIDEMLYDLENGKEKGVTTHIPDIDMCWKWRGGEANLWTGYANEGKSLMLRSLALVKVLEKKWNFLFNAPEDFPAKEFYDDMIHTLTGFPTDKDHPQCIKKDLYMEAYELIKDHFQFIYIKPPNNTIEDALGEFQKLIDEYDIQGVILDPLLKFARPDKFMQRDDLYASYIGSMCMDFARINNVSFSMVMHQLTPEFDKDGYYVKPSMYRIKGGGSWSDGFDNILFTQRPYYAKDKVNQTVIFGSQKIKKQKLVGIPQELMMTFNRKTNRYGDFNTKDDLYDFDKWFQ